MRDLEPQHRFALSASIGWLELGNPKEALLELDGLSSPFRSHPATLEVRWRVYSSLEHWDQALEVAADLVRTDPNNPAGWINQSYCLHELRRTQDAWDRLLPAAKKFPLVATVPYNLACYACQLDRTTLAVEWLGKAARLMGKEQLLKMATADSDLEPIKGQIEQL